jgi:phosphopantothenoylcysteine decarboxylase/phosphopantothenate--cysteine ligase
MAARRVLLVVTGGIAVYKACLLTRLLVQAGCDVRIVMTDAARRFVTPLTFGVLSGRPVAIDLWSEGPGAAMDHIELARWAELAVVAPATANTLAKLAHGLADNLATSLLLAYPGPLLIVPAMNNNMWGHPATQANLALLRERGAVVVGPLAGDLACGTVDVGRMAEPEEIVARVRELLAESASVTKTSGDGTGGEGVRGEGTGGEAVGAVSAALAPSAMDGEFARVWRGRRVIVTAGPTHEALDPVRYLTNRSTGAFGHAIAAAAAAAGARVVLVAGPTAELPPRGLERLVRITSAAELAQEVASALDAGADWLFMAAAVADFAPARVEVEKLKKENVGATWALELRRTPDILAEIVPRHRQPTTRIVGFALETADLVHRAQEKLRKKSLDFVVANDPTGPEGTFGPGEHRVRLFGPHGELWTSELRTKSRLAELLIEQLARAVEGSA